MSKWQSAWAERAFGRYNLAERQAKVGGGLRFTRLPLTLAPSLIDYDATPGDPLREETRHGAQTRWPPNDQRRRVPLDGLSSQPPRAHRQARPPDPQAGQRTGQRRRRNRPRQERRRRRGLFASPG